MDWRIQAPSASCTVSAHPSQVDVRFVTLSGSRAAGTAEVRGCLAVEL